MAVADIKTKTRQNKGRKAGNSEWHVMKLRTIAITQKISSEPDLENEKQHPIFARARLNKTLFFFPCRCDLSVFYMLVKVIPVSWGFFVCK